MPCLTQNEFAQSCADLVHREQQRAVAASPLWRMEKLPSAQPGCCLVLTISRRVCQAANVPENDGYSFAVDDDSDRCESDDDTARGAAAAPTIDPTSSSPLPPIPSILLEMEYYVVWSAAYGSPVIYFSALATPLTPHGSSQLLPSSNVAQPFRPTVQQLRHWVMPGICDPLVPDSSETELPAHAFGRPIVSEGFCEELQRAMFSVHPCDMETMIQIADDVLGSACRSGGGDHMVNLSLTPYRETTKVRSVGGRSSSIIVRLLRMCGPWVGIPPGCLPPE